MTVANMPSQLRDVCWVRTCDFIKVFFSGSNFKIGAIIKLKMITIFEIGGERQIDKYVIATIGFYQLASDRTIMSIKRD